MGYIGVRTHWSYPFPNFQQDIQVILVASKKPKVMLHRSTGGEKHVQEKLCFFVPKWKGNIISQKVHFWGSSRELSGLEVNSLWDLAMWGDSTFDIHVNVWKLPKIANCFDSSYLETYVFFTTLFETKRHQ